MTNLEPSLPGERPFRQEMWNAARSYFGGRTGIILAAVAVLGAGAYLNWGWLVALGLAPVIISALPCAAMCAFGLCMSGRSHKPGDTATPSTGSEDETGAVQSLRRAVGDDANGEDHAKRSGTSCC